MSLELAGKGEMWYLCPVRGELEIVYGGCESSRKSTRYFESRESRVASRNQKFKNRPRDSRVFFPLFADRPSPFGFVVLFLLGGGGVGFKMAPRWADWVTPRGRWMVPRWFLIRRDLLWPRFAKGAN